jgi:tape measure domain-containing protein
MAVKLEFKSDSRKARSDLGKLERSVQGIDNNVGKAAKSMNTLASAAKVAAAAMAGILAVKSLAKVADEFTNIENRIALVTGRTNELNTTFVELQKSSLKARGGLTGMADLYNRLGRSTKSLGVSNQELLQVTETIQKAIVISGAEAAAANAAIVQLGQGLAAGALRGQELNSVMEQTPRVASAIAAELGVGVGQLRKLAEQGKITSEVVVNAFKNQADVINDEFGQMDATVGQGFEQLGQNIKLVTREFLAGSGAPKAFAQGLLNTAEALQKMAPGARKAGEAIKVFVSAFSITKIVGALKELGTDGVAGLDGFSQAILSFAGKGLQKSGDLVMKFVKLVNDAFYWVMDKVVGNSWWPDLIDGVVDYTSRVFESLYIVEDFTYLVSESFKEALSTVIAFGKSLGDTVGEFAGKSFDVAITTRQAGNLFPKGGPTLKSFVAITSAGFIDVAAAFLDFLEAELPYIFGAAAGQFTALIIALFGSTRGKIALLIGNAMAAGLRGYEVAKSIGEMTELFALGMGRAIGAIFNPVNIIGFVSRMAFELIQSAMAFGDALLDNIGIIGKIIQFLTLGLAGNLVGVLVTVFAGKRIFNFFFKSAKDGLKEGAKAAENPMSSVIDRVVSAVKANKFFQALTSKLRLFAKQAGSALGAVFNTIKGLGGVFVDALTKGAPKGGIKELFPDMSITVKKFNKELFITVGLFKGLAKGEVTAAEFNAQLLKTATALKKVVAIGIKGFIATSKLIATNTKRLVVQTLVWIKLNGLSYISLGITLALTAANAALTLSFAVLSVAAKVAWAAITGPLFPVIAAVTVLTTVFANLIAALLIANEETARLNGTTNRLANDLGLGFNLDIDIKVDVESAEEALDSIADYNRATLFQMEKDSETSSIFGWVDDAQTQVEILGASVVTMFGNTIKRAENFRRALGAAITGSIPEEIPLETRDAVQKLLDQKGAFRIKIKSTSKEIDEFISDEQQDALASALATATAAKEELTRGEKGRFFGFVDTLEADLISLRNQAELTRKEAERLARAVDIDINLEKQIRGMVNQLNKLNVPAEALAGYFGESVVESRSLLQLASANAQQFNLINASSGKLATINEDIREVLGQQGKMTEARRNELSRLLKLARAEEVLLEAKLAKTKELLAVESALEVVDNEIALKLSNKQLEKALSLQTKIRDLQIDYNAQKELAESGDTEAKARANSLRLQLAQAQVDSERLATQFARDVQGNLTNVLETFGNSGVGLTLQEFSQLDSKARASILALGDKLIAEEVNLANARINLTGEALDEAKLAFATASVDIGKTVAEKVRVGLLKNFDKVLDPFKKIGTTFSNEDFTKLGARATAEALAQAEVLAATMKEIDERSYETTKAGQEQRLKDIAAFTDDMIEFERELARQRKDALKNERDAATLASAFSSNIISALKGEADFGESFTETILDSIENSLQERITAFASGFIETFLSGVETAEGAGGTVGRAVKGVIFGPSEEEKENLKNAGASLFGEAKVIGGALLVTMTNMMGPTGAAQQIAGSAGGISWQQADVSDTLGDVQAQLPDFSSPQAGEGGLFSPLTELFEGDSPFMTKLSGLFSGDAPFLESLGGLFGDLAGGLGGVFQSLMGSLGGGGGGAGGILSLIGSFAGFKDNGGTIPYGKFGIAGENGPEFISGPAKVTSTQKTASMMGGGGNTNNVTFALEGDFDTRAERSIRKMINSGSLQAGLNNSEVENGGSGPIFRTP